MHLPLGMTPQVLYLSSPRKKLNGIFQLLTLDTFRKPFASLSPSLPKEDGRNPGPLSLLPGPKIPEWSEGFKKGKPFTHFSTGVLAYCSFINF